MRTSVVLAVCAAAAMAMLVGCGGDDEAATKPNPAPTIAQKTCPVMRGNPINPEIYVDYNGRRIYFCCNMCPPQFKADPEKYLKIVDEDLKKAAPAAPLVK